MTKSLCTITRLYGHTKVRLRLTEESITDIQSDIIFWQLAEYQKRKAARRARNIEQARREYWGGKS